MIDDLPNLFLAWSIQFTGVVSPGPGVALILGIATAQGRGAALRCCLGIGLGGLLLAALTVFGLAALLAEWRGAMIAARWIGAAYLAWLAWGAFRKAARPPAVAGAAPAAARHSLLRQIAGGFAFQLSNPKAIFFWIAIASVGALHTVSPAALLLFLAGAFAISFGGHAGWALLLSSAPFRRLYARARRGVETALGAFFALTALKLAAARP